jgi:hypothetical protein
MDKTDGEIIMGICQFYALENSEKEMFVYDNYDFWISGRYISPILCHRLPHIRGRKIVKFDMIFHDRG